MVELTLWIFPNPYGGEAVVGRLKHLCAHQLVRLEEAALVAWPEHRPAPLVKPLAELPRTWELDDAFWGLLAGVLFHQTGLSGRQVESEVPLRAVLTALGVDDELVTAIRAKIVRGTSALLLVLDRENARRIGMAIDGMAFTLLERPLDCGQAQRLQSVFSSAAD